MTLYKYLVPERIDVVTGGSIRFTQASALNDPFELSAYLERLMPEDILSESLKGSPELMAGVTAEYYKWPADLRSQVPLATFLALVRENLDNGVAAALANALAASVEQNVLPRFRERLRTTLATKVGILSLSESAESAPMWAHYAHNHRGLVLAFDERNPWFARDPESELGSLRKVAYRDPSAFHSVRDLSGDRVFLTKRPSWAYEQEWRVLESVANATSVIDGVEPIYLFDFPPAALQAVILGARASNELDQAVGAVMAYDGRYQHVRFFRARFDEATASIRIEGGRAAKEG